MNSIILLSLTCCAAVLGAEPRFVLIAADRGTPVLAARAKLEPAEGRDIARGPAAVTASRLAALKAKDKPAYVALFVAASREEAATEFDALVASGAAERTTITGSLALRNGGLAFFTTDADGIPMPGTDPVIEVDGKSMISREWPLDNIAYQLSLFTGPGSKPAERQRLDGMLAMGIEATPAGPRYVADAAESPTALYVRLTYPSDGKTVHHERALVIADDVVAVLSPATRAAAYLASAGFSGTNADPELVAKQCALIALLSEPSFTATTFAGPRR